jgi:hypothetical protein
MKQCQEESLDPQIHHLLMTLEIDILMRKGDLPGTRTVVGEALGIADLDRHM